MNDEEARALLSGLIAAIKRMSLLSDIYKTANGMYRPIEVIAKADHSLGTQLQTLAVEISSQSDHARILYAAGEMEKLLVPPPAKKDSKKFLTVTQKKYLPAYARFRELHPDLARRMLDLETRIIDAPSFVRDYHKLLERIQGKFARCHEARLNDNFRTIYKLDGTTIVFMDVVKHDEIEK
ncbi:MAG TPA: hypothetical protein VLJ21_01675 [Candidatus Binatia bacterium]|nr:hypothetical protein [Candidatus Binatia bacterium]